LNQLELLLSWICKMGWEEVGREEGSK